jgi:hypothetical protein
MGESATPVGWVIVERYIEEGSDKQFYLMEAGYVRNDFYTSEQSAKEVADQLSVEFLLSDILPQIGHWLGADNDNLSDRTDEELCRLCYALTGANPDTPEIARSTISALWRGVDRLPIEAAQESLWILEHFSCWRVFKVKALFLA